MNSNKTLFAIILGSMVIASFACTRPSGSSSSDNNKIWPETKASMKPWMRWWWMGNAVDRQNITNRLEEFADAGIGGVEIVPIFGVKGFEDRFIDYLSPEWMEMLVYTIDEAERLGMGVDMIMGTGWPFGGPQVETEFAASKIIIRNYQIESGKEFRQKIKIEDPNISEMAGLQYVFSFDNQGNKKDLISFLRNDMLEWKPDYDGVIYAVFVGKTGQLVKRAAPGGEGFTLDHFSEEALRDYVKPFTQSLGPVQGRLRAVFNDSYEVYGADYTPRFFEEFQKRRGYDLSDHLPVLVSDFSDDKAKRVRSDYRETIADLVFEAFSENWASWATNNSFMTKYQAHGCPGNLLDIYATADIPECETFFASRFNIPGLRWEEEDTREAQPDLILLKFASSAAHISGRPLTSSESLTWLREHFKTALSQCKPEIEQVFLSGVNHMFLHGSTYYPDEAQWPGWKFYASVNFVPANTIWKDVPYMFDFITRCQTFLQSGTSDNELLVYWPFYDVMGMDSGGELLVPIAYPTKNDWLVQTPFYKLVRSLLDNGFSLDYVSDRFLQKAEVQNGKIRLPGMSYESLIVPDCSIMPVATMNSLIRLSESGGKVVFGGLPESTPGFYLHNEKTQQLLDLINEAGNNLNITGDIQKSLESMGIRRETFTDSGLEFIRRDLEDGKAYFLVNHTPDAIDDYIKLSCEARSVIVLDPLTGKYGQARIRGRGKGTDVYLQLKPGQSIILRTFKTATRGEGWEYNHVEQDPVELTGTWDIQFLSGGPIVPEDARFQELKSWTTLSDHAESFSGTARYTIHFENPDPGISNWLLDLGDVRESARVWINGEYIGCLWSVPFVAETGILQEGNNILEIEVTNLSANRIRHLERSGREWKNFYEINMVNRYYKEFDATGWEPMPSGLLGRVRLYPLGKNQF
ncbi:MAG: glycoside hydrolase [Bacteroidales bacterium]|nr:glycoside hydrolase [Bacteroidales bacterium]